MMALSLKTFLGLFLFINFKIAFKVCDTFFNIFNCGRSLNLKVYLNVGKCENIQIKVC